MDKKIFANISISEKTSSRSPILDKQHIDDYETFAMEEEQRNFRMVNSQIDNIINREKQKFQEYKRPVDSYISWDWADRDNKQYNKYRRNYHRDAAEKHQKFKLELYFSRIDVSCDDQTETYFVGREGLIDDSNDSNGIDGKKCFKKALFGSITGNSAII